MTVKDAADLTDQLRLLLADPERRKRMGMPEKIDSVEQDCPASGGSQDRSAVGACRVTTRSESRSGGRSQILYAVSSDANIVLNPDSAQGIQLFDEIPIVCSAAITLPLCLKE